MRLAGLVIPYASLYGTKSPRRQAARLDDTGLGLHMSWPKLVGGLLLVLLGLIWIGQGLNLLPGSVMSGQTMWAIIGAVVALVGAWLLWSTRRAPGSM